MCTSCYDPTISLLDSCLREMKVKVKSLSPVQLFAITWTVAYLAPLSMGFLRQEDWSGLPFPPWDLPDPGIEYTSSLAGGFFITEPPRKP